MSRRTRTPDAVMTYRQCRQARRQASQATARRYQTLARSPHVAHDPTTTTAAAPRTRLVRLAAEIVDRDPTLVAWVTDQIEAGYRRPGRPRELSVRTGLICYLLQVLVQRHFMLLTLPDMLGQMTWRVRRQLSIDYLRNGQPTHVTYTQLVDLFHLLADTFDAWDPAIPATDEGNAIRRERANNLQQLVDRLTAASTARAPMWSGNAALDATLKWSWERPPDVSLNSKIERAGRDGYGTGRSLPLSKIVADDNGDVDPTQFADPDPVAIARTAGRTTRPRNWPTTWSLGSAWVGRGKNKTKSVHGIALHSVVRSDGPTLVEAFTVTPANADPVAAALPIMRRIYDQRAAQPDIVAAAARGEVAILGQVVADPAYTTTAWMAQLKLLAAQPVGRLHRQNQDGIRWHKIGKGSRAGDIATIAGRPVCECVTHTHLPDLRFPKFPYTTAQLHAYQREIVKLADFEWSPNSAAADDGSRRWLAPHRHGPDGHTGGCDHCTHRDGAPVTNPDGRPRRCCCQTISRTLPLEITALDQGVIHGSPDWYPMWNVRNRVEGSYGILKNLAVVNYCRASHHYVGLARETLVALFSIVAYNVHMLRQWQQRQDTTVPDDEDPFTGLPTTQMTATLPAPIPPTAPKAAKGPQGTPVPGHATPTRVT